MASGSAPSARASRIADRHLAASLASALAAGSPSAALGCCPSAALASAEDDELEEPEGACETGTPAPPSSATRLAFGCSMTAVSVFFTLHLSSVAMAQAIQVVRANEQLAGHQKFLGPLPDQLNPNSWAGACHSIHPAALTALLRRHLPREQPSARREAAPSTHRLGGPDGGARLAADRVRWRALAAARAR